MKPAGQQAKVVQEARAALVARARARQVRAAPPAKAAPVAARAPAKAAPLRVAAPVARGRARTTTRQRVRRSATPSPTVSKKAPEAPAERVSPSTWKGVSPVAKRRLRPAA